MRVKNALVCMNSACSDVGGAMRVFNSVHASYIFTYNSIMAALVKNGYLNEALDVWVGGG